MGLLPVYDPAPPSPAVVISSYTAMITSHSVFTGIAVIAVAARLYVRSVIIKSLGLDELCIVIGLVRFSVHNTINRSDMILQIFSLAALTIVGIMTHDREAIIRQMPEDTLNLLPGLKYQQLSPFLTIFSVTFTRVSVCFFLLRIVAVGQKWKAWVWKTILYSIMAFALVTGIPTGLITIFPCRPVAKLWNPMMPGSCWKPIVVIAIGDFYGGEPQIIIMNCNMLY